MTAPIVSVIIPVGPAHVRYVPQAMASVRWQTVKNTETIVVNDTGRDLDADSGLGPWRMYTVDARSPAYARNQGIQVARAPFVLFLDADDYLLPGGVETLLRGYAENDVGYVYGDVYTTIEAPGAAPNIGRTPDYDQQNFARFNLHVVTALVPTKAARVVGGFDEAALGFEDWTLFLRLAIAGVCGKRIPQMTMVYRTGLGERAKDHGQSHMHAQRLMEQVTRRYKNKEGVIEMAGCCGGDAPLREAAQEAVADLPPPDDMVLGPGGTVRMEFYGPERGNVTYRSPRTGQSYTLGNNAVNRFANVHPDDVAWLQSLMEIRIVPPVAPFVPPPDVVKPDSGATALKPRK